MRFGLLHSNEIFRILARLLDYLLNGIIQSIYPYIYLDVLVAFEHCNSTDYIEIAEYPVNGWKLTVKCCCCGPVGGVALNSMC